MSSATKYIHCGSKLVIGKRLDRYYRIAIPKSFVDILGWQHSDSILYVPVKDKKLNVYSKRMMNENDYKKLGTEVFINFKFDDLGRIVIPKEFRAQWKVKEGEYVTIEGGNNCLVLSIGEKCCLCGSSEVIYLKGNDGICEVCAKDISASLSKFLGTGRKGNHENRRI